MAFCINCGNQNADGIKFCTSCGKALEGGAAPSQSGGAASGSNKVGGGIKKCPGCGQPIESFQSKCPGCGHELNNVRVVGSIQAFVRKLEKATTYTEMREMIEAFPIPNTKEDIFEFAILAVTKIKPEGSKTNSAWQTKLKQVYLKAQLIFTDDAGSLTKLKGMIDESESIGVKIADMAAKPISQAQGAQQDKNMAPRKKRAGIIAGIVVLVVIATVIAIRFLVIN